MREIRLSKGMSQESLGHEAGLDRTYIGGVERGEHESGYVCVPIIIAESWTGDLESLGCEKTIYININPNRINTVEERLRNEISEIRDYIQQICLYE